MRQPNKQYREKLKEKAAEIRSSLRSRDGMEVQTAADEMDRIHLTTERDLAVDRVERASRVLNQIEQALARLEDGSFGTCTECEETIPPKRLQALPWASRCVACQEGHDRLPPQSSSFSWRMLAA